MPLLLAGFFASVVSLHFSIWYLPLLFTFLALVGSRSGLKSIFYFGLGMAVLTFAYMNRFLPYSELALIRIIGVYLVFFVAWRLYFASRLFQRVASPDNMSHLVINHHLKLLVNISLACVLSLIGSLMAFQGFAGTFFSPTILFLILAFLLFILLIVMLRYLPDHITKSYDL